MCEVKGHEVEVMRSRVMRSMDMCQVEVHEEVQALRP